MQAVTVDPLTEFFDAIQNPLTKAQYAKRLDIFLKHIQIDGKDLSERTAKFVSKAKEDPVWATTIINQYMRYQKSRAENKEISVSTVPNYYKPIRLLCQENDILLNWKKISRRIPKGRSFGEDRVPTIKEVRTILTYHDRRIKLAVLIMYSSGIRIGAFEFLKWGNITPIESEGQVIAAKIVVYANTNDEYYSFITKEAYNSVKEYIEFRAAHNEKITPESPVLRNLFPPDLEAKGLSTVPKLLRSLGVKRMIENALWATEIRKPLPEGIRRHPFKCDHGFRKLFKSICERHMKSLHVEIFLGHNTGLNENYYRPTEQELLDEYLKAAPYLIVQENIKPVPELQDVTQKLLDIEQRLAQVEREKEIERSAKTDLLTILNIMQTIIPEDKESDLYRLIEDIQQRQQK